LNCSECVYSDDWKEQPRSDRGCQYASVVDAQGQERACLPRTFCPFILRAWLRQPALRTLYEDDESDKRDENCGTDRNDLSWYAIVRAFDEAINACWQACDIVGNQK